MLMLEETVAMITLNRHTLPGVRDPKRLALRQRKIALLRAHGRELSEESRDALESFDTYIDREHHFSEKQDARLGAIWREQLGNPDFVKAMLGEDGDAAEE